MIQVTIDSNEQGAERAKLLIGAIWRDKRFAFLGYKKLEGIDVLFESGNLSLGTELKLAEDFVASVIGGHLMEQVLTMREMWPHAIVLILADQAGIYKAIKESAQGRGKCKNDVNHIIALTHNRLKSFKKRSYINGVSCHWQGDDSGFFDGDDIYLDFLEFAIDFLTDGDMLGFGIRPPENEREVYAASRLFTGIGPTVMRTLLEDYKLVFVPRKAYARPVEEMPKIGAKRAKMLNERIVMWYGGKI